MEIINDTEILSPANEDLAVFDGRRTAKRISKFINNDTKVVVDLGANVGTVSVLLALKYDIKVYSIEPHPVLYGYLLRNIAKYNLQNQIVPYNLAIGSKKEMYIGDNYRLGNTGIERCSYNGGDCKHKVQGVTLNDFMDFIEDFECIDVLKIDCEGCEYDILTDFTKWSKFNYLDLEIHSVPSEFLHKVTNLKSYDSVLGPYISFMKHILTSMGVNYDSSRIINKNFTLWGYRQR